jgi:hypothetical protein
VLVSILVVGFAPRQLEQSSKPDDCSRRSNQPTACGPSESILDVRKSSLPNFCERSCQVQVAHAILARKLNLEAGEEHWFAAIRGANISVHSVLDTTDHGQEKAKSAAM